MSEIDFNRSNWIPEPVRNDAQSREAFRKVLLELFSKYEAVNHPSIMTDMDAEDHRRHALFCLGAFTKDEPETSSTGDRDPFYALLSASGTGVPHDELFAAYTLIFL